MPALEMDTVCCSITSWMEVRSDSSILSNSSMQQTPLSARTRAPPSEEKKGRREGEKKRKRMLVKYDSSSSKCHSRIVVCHSIESGIVS